MPPEYLQRWTVGFGNFTRNVMNQQSGTQTYKQRTGSDHGKGKVQNGTEPVNATDLEKIEPCSDCHDPEAGSNNKNTG